jgi:hypothetical protein
MKMIGDIRLVRYTYYLINQWIRVKDKILGKMDYKIIMVEITEEKGGNMAYLSIWRLGYGIR